MKIPRLKKGDLVEIIWSDTNIPGDVQGWMTEKELSSFLNSNGGIVKSVGIYNGKSKNKKYIQLVGDTDGDDVPDKSSLRPINIAVGYIIQVYQLVRIDMEELKDALKKRKVKKSDLEEHRGTDALRETTETGCCDCVGQGET